MAQPPRAGSISLLLGGAAAGLLGVVVGLLFNLAWFAWLGVIAAMVCLALLPGALEGSDELQADDNSLKQAAERSEASFLSVAGHDLRQPVQAVALFAATLAAQPLPDNSRRLVMQLEEASNALGELFEAVIAYAKAHGGRYEIIPQRVAVHEIFNAAIGEHLPLAHERDTHLRHVPTRAEVRADPVLLARVLSLMVRHALLNTPQGGAVLGCRWRAARVGIELWVSGHTQPVTPLLEATQPFAAAWQSMGDRGLGLAWAARLVQDMGGALSLHGVRGGVCYRIELPRA